MAIIRRNSTKPGTAKKKAPQSIGRRRFHARIIRYRRPLAVMCAVIAALCLARIAQPPAPRTVTAVVAAHDLSAGELLDSSDVRSIELVADAAWQGIASDKATVIGATTSHALASGQPLDSHAVVGPSLLDGLPFTMRALVVTISPNTEHMIAHGDHVDLLAGSSGALDASMMTAQQTGAELIASDVVVLATSGSAQGGLLNSSGRAGSSITVAATAEQSMRIAQYSSSELVVALRNIGD